MNRTVLTPIYNVMGEGGQAKLRRCCSSLIILSLTLFAFNFWSLSATAQTITSTIEGTVTDANGAVVAGAEVKASGTTLAAERSATTDAEGFYRLTALPAGTYTLTVSQTGLGAPPTSS